MGIPKEIASAAARLKEGRWIKRITVRQLLKMFKAERRGMNKVQDIRTTLDEAGLETDPDFESAWIDSLIRLRLKSSEGTSSETAVEAEPDELDEGSDEEALSAEEGAESSTGDVATVQEVTKVSITASVEGVVETALSEKAPSDPTFRIGNFPAANKKLVTVGQDDPLNKAVTRMLQCDFSQLPIMQGEREVKGVISWRSIGARYALGVSCEKVRDAREDAQVIDANGTLFDAIPTIVKHGYVLVRDQKDKRITGIVTASDLSLQFQQLAEPFILLREIELHIRRLLKDKVSSADLAGLVTADMPNKKLESIADLSFGEYIRLFQHPDFWAKLSLKIDKTCLTDQLEDVRKIRNDVMHFDPDPMTSKQLEALKDAAKFMQQLFELLPS
jgi:predicted transcriptional regulator